MLTLALLGLLVLAVFALSALVRVNGQVSASSAAQLQARQNALLALGIGLSELQKNAGPDSRITGMAGVAGVPNAAASSTRYWTGVWRDDGTFVSWLTSGAIASNNAGTDTIELVATSSVGTASSTSVNVEKEHVIAGKIPIGILGTTVGKYAFVVLDEGSKLGAGSDGVTLANSNAVPRMSSGLLTNQLNLRTALQNNPANVLKAVSFEQLSMISTPALTPSVLQDTFHYVTRSNRFVSGGQLMTGAVNLNSTNTLLWRSILDTYNSVTGVPQISASLVTSRGRAIGDGFAASNTGKSSGGPFTSVAGFSAYLATIFPGSSSPTAAQIVQALGAMLQVRSDTFRIRAYGEALNAVDSTQTEAVAYCEAIVQRTPDTAPNGLGRRFVVTYFRWLGPGDI
ncbi:MAG: hypothetical protein KF715_01685 [Candidatus Didemnitutus sp.]|nr:hypothetical protein [Candidatus Didemnitutus sp.]